MSEKSILASGSNNNKARASKILLGSLGVFFSVFVVIFMGFSVTAMNTSCSSPEIYGNKDITNEELTTGHQAQNIISSPFRLIGGMVIYPLKALLVDFPTSLYNSLDGELDEYEEKLRAGSLRDKEEALFFLAYVNEPKAWKLIVKAFQDENAEIRKQAVLTLVKRKDTPEQAIDAVRTMLMDIDPTVELAAIYAIGEIGSAEDMTYLRDVFRDKERADVFRSFALLSLSKLGAQDAELEAIKILKKNKQHPVMSANALMSIGYAGIQTEEGAKFLHDSVNNEDDRIGTAAVTGLGVAGEFIYLENLLKSKEVSQTIKKKILVALGEYGGNAKIRTIRSYLFLSKNDELRQYAIFGLAKARYKPIISELIENLRLDSPEIKTNIRKQPNLRIQLLSLSFLYELTGQNFGLEYKPWKEWWDSNKEDFLKPSED